ncbi:hypothetical protein LguiA_035897 [Lonicera macranthoides]
MLASEGEQNEKTLRAGQMDLLKKKLSLTNDVHRIVRSKHDVGRRIKSYSKRETPEDPDMKVDHDRQG